MEYLLPLFLIYYCAVVASLKFNKFQIPSSGEIGGTVILEYDYDLEGEELYAVKWYKDQEEFYRYIPEDTPKVHTFKLEGIQINTTQSMDKKIILQNLNKRSAGVYSCEISIGAPTFHTIFEASRMEIVESVSSKPSTKFIQMKVPTSAILNGTVTLECDYNLKYEELYAVKWYKDNMEFYRYVPKETPSIKTFAVIGVHIDITASDNKKVVLQKLEKSSTGNYICEVIADAPSFYAAQELAHMEVVETTTTEPSTELIQLKVPSSALVNTTVTLECDYNLKGDILYAVKWYKGNMEFYRYVPKEMPKAKSFPVKGIHIDIAASDDKKVVLQKLEKSNAGNYTCEVSTEAPSFQSTRKSARMEVVDINSDISNTNLETAITEPNTTFIQLKVPSSALLNGTVTLECDYNLKGNALYSIKWYKENMEFYRYVPKEIPKIKLFPVKGIHIDITVSDDKKVVLQNLEKSNAGNYTCEVSTDAPLFQTEQKSARMEVVDIASTNIGK